MMKRIGWLGERFCLLCAAVFCGVILAQSLHKSLSVWGVVVGAGAVCAGAVIWLGLKYWPLGSRGTSCAVFALRFSIAMAVILVIGNVPIQDFNTMYTAAQDMAQGGRNYLDNIYFYKWAYQTGFVLYESVLLRLFGPGQFSLQVMNALWLGGIGVLVHQIARRLFSERVAAVVAVFYAVYPAPYFLAAVLTNQHIAVFFFYLALWLLLRRDEIALGDVLLAGAAVAVGNVLRPIGVVVLLAVGCWRVFRLLLHRGMDWKKEMVRLGGLVVSYALVFGLISNGIVWSGLNPEGLGNNLPMWKFVVGLNQESNGLWNRADYENYQILPATPEEGNAAMEEELKVRLGVGPVALGKLAVRKSAVMWGDNEDMYWCFGHLNGQAQLGPLTLDQWSQVLARGDKGVYMTAFALALVGVLSMLRRGTRAGGGGLLLAFLLCGYYAVHLIVEVQSRYRYFLLPGVFLLAGYGLSVLIGKKERNA